MTEPPESTDSPAKAEPPPKPPRNTRRWVFETIFEHDTRAGIVFDISLLLVIVISILVVMLESVSSIQLKYGAELRAAEWTLTIFFTIEYLTRMLCHPKPALYARSFFGIVDVLAILPTYIAAIIPGAQALVVVRMLRLLRVFRILKLAHFVSQADELGRALHASLPKIIVFVITIVALTTISGSAMYLIEGPEHGFSNIPESVYWAVVTLSTVGYGDIAPETPIGKFVASLIMIMGYGVIAVPTGIVGAELVKGPRPTGVSGQLCTGCGTRNHAHNALFCNRCGTDLHQ